MTETRIDWIAVDWGTSRLRCWGLGADDEVLAETVSERGMAAVAGGGGDFERALREVVGEWLSPDRPTRVVACGMVGAKEGWQECPYTPTPCSPLTALRAIQGTGPDLEVFIHAGLRQDEPADVMRGEETQISGFLSGVPGYGGWLCLPGTHSKWARVADGQVLELRTFLTGEMFGLLASESLLRNTVAPDGHDRSAFLAGVARGEARSLLADCFSLRAEHLLHGLDPVAARSRLSGMLVGSELAEARRLIGETDGVAVLGTKGISDLYGAALEAIGVKVQCHDATAATLAGLIRSKQTI